MRALRWVGAIVALGAAALIYSARPGTLYIKVANSPWTSVTITSQLHETKSFSPGADPRYSPLEHGRYRVTVTFSDGQVAYLTYYHFDAGVRKRADMIIERSADGKSVQIIQTYNHAEKVEGTIPILKTSEDKPFLLEGPA